MTEQRVRASSWGLLFECAHMWEGINLLKIRNTVGLRAVMGTAIHEGTAAFDKARLEHSPIRVDDAAGILVDRLQHPGEEYSPLDEDPPMREAERICLSLLSTYCIDWSHRWAWEAVEMETKPLNVDCGGDVTIVLTGTMDRSRIYKESQGSGVTDIKTGVSAVQRGRANTKQHRAQVGVYELLYEHTTGRKITKPAEIVGMKTSGNPEIRPGQIHNAKLALTGTPEQPGLIEMAADTFRSGMFRPNPRSNLCNPKYCPRWNSCIFR